MAALIKLDPAAVDTLVARIDGLVIANDNVAGQVVVAGPPDAVEAVRELAREAGGRALPLDVEGAFHSPAMAPAVGPVTAALDQMTLHDPSVPLVSGRDGKVLGSGAQIGEALIDGILSPVRWRAVQAQLATMGVTDLIEVGPGGVLAGLAKRALPHVRIHRVENPGDLATVQSILDQADDSAQEPEGAL